MRTVVLVTGSIILIFGLLSMLTPIPGGTLFITLGGGMIICSSERSAKYIQVCRTKYRRIDSGMYWLENKMGERFSGPLRRTRPRD